MSDVFCLTDAQMARLEPFFPKSRMASHALMIDVCLSGIIFINRNGLSIGATHPSAYGPTQNAL